MKAKTVIIMSTILVLLLAGTVAPAKDNDVLTYRIEEPIEDSQPTITVSFGEGDIVWVEHELRFKSQSLADQPLPRMDEHSLAPNNNRYRFSTPSDAYLFDENYVFYAKAEDVEGNTITVYVEFTVDTPQQDLYLQEPQNPYLEEKSTFGMSTKNAFNFSIRAAERPVERCRWVFSSQFPGDVSLMSAEELYSYLGANTELPSTTDGYTHYDEDFDMSYQEEAELHPITVACLEHNGEASKAALAIGYDRTAPRITSFTATPDTIIDPNHVRTTINLTTDDPAYCTFTNPEYPLPDNGRDYQYTDFEVRHVLDASSYAKTTNETLTFKELQDHPFQSEKPPTYTINATCENMAGNKSARALTITIDYAEELSIKTIAPRRYENTQGIDYEFTTNMEALCILVADKGTENEQEISLETDDNKAYTGSEKHEEGEHTYEVNCQAVGGYSQRVKKTFTIDSAAPGKVNITNYPGAICGEGTLSAEFAADDEVSGVDHYHYLIKNGNEVLVDKNTSSEGISGYRLAGENKDTYTITASAVDEAGNEGSPTTTSKITYYEDAEPACDHTPPKTKAIITPRQGEDGMLVNITCEDDESGCQGTAATYTTSKECERNESLYTDEEDVGSPFLITSTTRLCWYVEDNALPEANKAYGATTVAGKFDINLLEPWFGIGDNETFDLVYLTSAEATCKAGFVNPNHPLEEKEWYGQLDVRPDVTGSKDHVFRSFDMIDAGASTCEGKDECEDELVIICEDKDGRYHALEHPVGYDVTAPVLDVKATPNPVKEPGNLQSTLRVESDDEVWCRYEREGDQGSYLFSEEPDASERSQYETEQERFLGYFPAPEDEDEYTVNYTVTCANLAGTTTEEDLALVVAPTNELGLKIRTGKEQAQRRVTLEATTELDATCDYRLDPEDEWQRMSKTGKKNHTTTHTFDEEGTYKASIYCEAVSGPYAAQATRTIIVDATAPQMLEIISPDQTCSLERITFTLISNASIIGLEAYNYTVTDEEGEPLIDWTRRSASGAARIRLSYDLKEDEKYTITATAIDELGRASKPLSKTVTAKGDQDESCDDEPPTASIRGTPVYGGIDLEVSCEDDQSGCTETYGLEMAASCTGEYDSYRYGTTQRMTQSGKACAIVYDQSGNNDSTTKEFRIIKHCANGAQDPEEAGVDCGGPCPASCETCANGRQDGDETGVDCGGVCPAACEERPEGYCEADVDCDEGTCEDHECVSAPQDECATDTDCPPGEECNYGSCTSITSPAPPEEKHTAGWALLIAGLILIIAGAGYLTYTTFINPPPSTRSGPQPAQAYEPPPQETPEQRAKKLAEEKRRLELQEEARKKAQVEKEQQRRRLMATFEDDDLVKTEEPSKAPKRPPKKKEQAAKLATAKDHDVFSELERIATQQPTIKGPYRTDEDVFADLADLTGSTKHKVRTTINARNATSDDLVRLFENAQRKDVTPKALTPMLKHLVGKGKIEHAAAHEAVHKLHEQEKLTHLQKEKILKDLEAIGEGR